MKADELREKYLEFFEARGHKRCPSDVLVPTWDPSVLFTPAGMNPFKDHFLGKVKLEFTRATSCQKCLRTGDIENVGRTPYHHTFFEMLGNFSFGDYFKREAILWAWEFLTSPKWLNLDPSRLSVSVYLDDDEAYRIWHEEVGLPQERIERMGEEENFWPAGAPTHGPDGVCGPCSEIFVHTERGPVEIWNLVFTQFNRVGPPPNNLRPLPSKNIDTGMGLERAASVLQNVDSNFHIDILRPIVEAAAEVCHVHYDPASDAGRRLRRITDHVRACTFAIHENVYPGPNREKYVVRRLLRRAVLDGHQLGCREPFLYQLVPVVVQMMKAPYPELCETEARVAEAIRLEEAAFFATLDDALRRIEHVFASMQSRGQLVVEGQAAADLYQTYGVPPELFESLAAEQGYAFDWEGFRKAMAEHGEKARKVVELFKTGPVENLKRALKFTEFVGYQTTSCQATVKGIVAGEELREEWSVSGPEHRLIVVLDRTPFYAEGGGQVGDIGVIRGEGFVYRVVDTQKDGDLILHYGYLESGTLRAGSTAKAEVDAERRQGIARAHTATHLLHYALRQTLGQHAQQQGSKVDDDWLRFDFTHQQPVTQEELEKIEQTVNQCIARPARVAWEVLPLRQARERGAMMLFGEKYPDPVRMVSIGDYSRELCGGTHLSDTSQVERFELVSEESVSAGTRRVVALTGRKAAENAARVQETVTQAARLLHAHPAALVTAVGKLLKEVRDLRKQLTSGAATAADSETEPPPADQSLDYPALKSLLKEAARLLNVSVFDVPKRLQALLDERDKLRQQVEQLRQTGLLSGESLLAEAESVGDTRLVIREIPQANPALLRHLIDQVRARGGSTAVLLAGTTDDGKVLIVTGVSRDLVQRGLHAGNWAKLVAAVVGGGGGGKPDMAQAGGKNPEKLPEALAEARRFAHQVLEGA
ncbi:MAG: alanine--tRNA ligase [Pirellulaceae bacterium]|nr:MAG: alanine--tRNA ligase [Pirellulaceae bacterium]